MSCPDENELAEYVDAVLEQDHRHAIGQHLDTCAACRTMVSTLACMQHAATDDDDRATHNVIAFARRSELSLETMTREASSLDVQRRKRTAHIVPGTMIGEYEVTGILGAGGMGIVFGAVHPRIGKKAAIKILQRDLALDPDALTRFENEARAVNAIGHPNIVDIFAFGELPDGDPYYVMEHVGGNSLAEWSDRRGPVSLELALPILRQICDALTAAHEHGIIHRDLKPGNIMVAGTEDAPRVKVLDFGLAKMQRTEWSGGDLTNPGVAIGTPAFMSPEQFMGNEVDQRTDVYALGVLVYALLTGMQPFGGSTPSEIGQDHLSSTPRPPSTIARLPRRIDDVIAKALAKDVADRYATIAELRRGLEECVTTPPLVTTPPPVTAPADVAVPMAAPAPRRSSRRGVVVATVGTAILAGALVWRFALRSSTEKSMQGSKLQTVEPSPLPVPPPPSMADNTPPTTAEPPAAQDATVAPQAPPRALPKPPPAKPTRRPGKSPATRTAKPTSPSGSAAPPPNDDVMLLRDGAIKMPQR